MQLKHHVRIRSTTNKICMKNIYKYVYLSIMVTMNWNWKGRQRWEVQNLSLSNMNLYLSNYLLRPSFVAVYSIHWYLAFCCRISVGRSGCWYTIIIFPFLKHFTKEGLEEFFVGYRGLVRSHLKYCWQDCYIIKIPTDPRISQTKASLGF